MHRWLMSTSHIICDLISANYSHDWIQGWSRLDQAHFNRILAHNDINNSPLDVNGQRCWIRDAMHKDVYMPSEQYVILYT